MKCKAKSKQSGEQCKRDVTPGKTVCHYHGGKTPTGIALPQTKSGRYSKVLPARMLERYASAIGDPGLLHLSEEIAVVDARIQELILRVESGDAGEIWDKLCKAKEKYRDASLKADIPEMGVQLDTIVALIERGSTDVFAWREIHTILEQRRRLVESERKRLVEQEQMLTLHEAMTLYQAMASAVKNNVTDRDVLSRIQTEWERLTNRPGQPMLSAGH